MFRRKRRECKRCKELELREKQLIAAHERALEMRDKLHRKELLLLKAETDAVRLMNEKLINERNERSNECNDADCAG